MQLKTISKISSVGLTAALLTGCNSANVKSSIEEIHQQVDYQALLTFGGMVAGAALCDDDDKVLCAATGGLIGNHLGKAVEEQKARLQALKESGAVNIEHATISTTNNSAKDNNGNVVAVKELNSFASGQATPTAEAVQKYQLLAAAYKDSPQKIMIVGHSDASGDAADNQQLSEQRAKSIAKIFIAQGVPADQVFYQGVGESRPVATNDTPAGRAANRRVEVVSVADTMSLLAYDQSESTTSQYLTHSTKTKAEQAEVQVQIVPQTYHQANATVVPAKSKIDFAGMPATSNINQLYASIGEPESPSQSWTLFTKAHAADMPPPSGSCFEDNPRQAGAIKSINGGELKRREDYSSSDYLPQMKGNSWVSTVNGHLVGMTPVRVLKETGDAIDSPVMVIYENSEQSKAIEVTKTVTNTYNGADGVLMRTFYLDEDAPVKCTDVVFAKQSAMVGQSLGGSLFYESGSSLLMTEFKPSVIKK